MSAQNKIFAAALLCSAVTASEHINTAFHELERRAEPVEHRRRFNLEAALAVAELNTLELDNEVDEPEYTGYEHEEADDQSGLVESSDNNALFDNEEEEEATNYFFEYPSEPLE